MAQWLRICLLFQRLRRRGFNPWVGKTLWRRKWQPAPVFLPGKSHGQSSLAGCSPWGHTESDTTLTHVQVEKRLEGRLLGNGGSVESSWCGHNGRGEKERNPGRPQGFGHERQEGWSSARVQFCELRWKILREAGLREKVMGLVLKAELLYHTSL